MQIAILGPLEVRDGTGAVVEIAGARLRTLLSRLALDAGRVVPASALVDAVWGADPPAEATNALQTLVSRLRRALGSAAIVSSGSGYRLALDPADVDAERFACLAADGSAALRAGEPARAGVLLADALALWRGAALADLTGSGQDGSWPVVTRLEDLRLAALVDRFEADLELGAAPVAELEALAAEQPVHERIAGQLIRALAAAGRPADALRAYERIRQLLADELGVDPAEELQALHLRLLRGELTTAPRPGARRTNLKAQLTTFVGREDEVARIGKSLEAHRLVTLVGPGGAGKTRLANEAAACIVDTAPDGIWLAELAAITAGADVAPAVLGSLGLREIHLLDNRTKPSARDAVSRLREGLADKRAVLIFDNCEHVIEASAALADDLLSECPDLRILTTSREPLGILGEVLLAVPPLGQPAASAPAVEALAYPAVRLFADRAAAVRPDFAVDDESVATVIEIVRRLDGLPLAIELAAARLRGLALDDIAERLSDRFRLLTGGSRTALPRHRTLRAVVEWSWDLLTAAERVLVEQLAVFPSGVTVESATAVRPAGVEAADVPDLLASLVDKSLLQPVDGGRRLRMLETIREYGADRLAERGELEAARSLHAAYFARLLDEAEPHLTKADQLPWFERLRAERENILAALRFRCDTGDADAALRIAVSLGGFAMMLGDHAEIGTWMTDALAVPGGQDADLRLIGRALVALTVASTGVSSVDVADSMRDLNGIAHELADVDTTRSPFMALLRPGMAYMAGESELAFSYAEQTIKDGDEWARAAVRMFRASLAENEGDLATMRAETETALTEFRRLGERWGTASTLRGLATLNTLDGDLDAAIEAYREALELMAEMNSTDDRIFLYGRLAELEIRRGNIAAARDYAQLAQGNAGNPGSPIEEVFTLAILASVERALGNVETSRALHRDARQRIALMPREHPAQGHVRSMIIAMSARFAIEDGDLAAAAELVGEAHTVALATRDLPIVAMVGVIVAMIAAATGDPAGAAQIAGACARLRGAEDLTAPEIAELLDRLRAALGPEFETEYERGRALTREGAIARLDPSGLEL